jgi:GNAT superfamily N-acetyltransferase
MRKNIRRFTMETYRIATVVDAKMLAIIKQKSWETTYRGIYSDDKIDNFDYDLHEQKFIAQIRSQENNVYVIEIDDEVVGYFSFGSPQHGSYKDFELCLNSLYILKDYQGRGIGSRVFAFVKDYCRNKGINKFFNACNSYNTKAKAFYKEMGGILTFEDSGHTDKAEDQCYFEHILHPQD